MVYHATLPPRADIQSVHNLRAQWLEGLQSQTEMEIDCKSVEFLSAAAAQLIISTNVMLKMSGGGVRLRQVSPALREDLILLGLPEYIQESAHHG